MIQTGHPFRSNPATQYDESGTPVGAVDAGRCVHYIGSSFCVNDAFARFSEYDRSGWKENRVMALGAEALGPLVTTF